MENFKRVNPDEVIKAYKNLNVKAVRGNYTIPGQNCFCALGALAIDKEGLVPNEDLGPDEVADMIAELDLNELYKEHFINAFDHSQSMEDYIERRKFISEGRAIANAILKMAAEDAYAVRAKLKEEDLYYSEEEF